MDEPDRSKLSLDSIRVGDTSTITNEPDARTRHELETLEAAAAKLDLEEKAANIKARKEYGNNIFVMVCTWLATSLVVVLLSGFGGPGGWFVLADSVLIALITTTTASVLGLFTIVVNYLFRKN